MWIGIAIFLVICWLLGFFLFHVSSFLIHILLLVALVSLIYHFIRGRRGASWATSSKAASRLPRHVLSTRPAFVSPGRSTGGAAMNAGDPREPVGPLATIGYEGASLGEVIRRLTDAGVRLVIDVRAVAASRRPGFSKTVLSASLGEAGIDYRHSPSSLT
jgi:hypothetical protein